MQGLQAALVKGLGPAAQGALTAAQLLPEEPDGNSGGSSGWHGELGAEGQGRGRGAGRAGRAADRQMAGGPEVAAVGEAALKVRESRGFPCVPYPWQTLISNDTSLSTLHTPCRSNWQPPAHKPQLWSGSGMH